MTIDEQRQLDDVGYVVLESAIDSAFLAELRSRILSVFDDEGERAGQEFRTEAHAHRLANLVVDVSYVWLDPRISSS